MFDGMISDDNDMSGVDALMELMNADNIDIKSDLEIKQIQALVLAKWFYLIQLEGKSTFECLNEVMDYYKLLKASYRRQSRKEVVKGISEMRAEMFMKNEFEKQK